jgi:hypothetical protein
MPAPARAWQDGGRAMSETMTCEASNPVLPPAPRPVRRRGRGPPIWAVAAFVFVGASLLGVGSFRLYVAYCGTPVRATIDQLAVNTDNDGTTYRAEFHYDLGGRTHVGKGLVSDRLRSLLHRADGSPGDGVVTARAVRLPGGRAFCLLEDGPLTWLMLTLAAAWAAIAVAAARAVYMLPARERWLVRNGEVAVGRVTAVGAHDRRSRSADIAFVFGSPGVTVRQRARRGANGFPQTGDVITVVYDAARPRRAAAYDWCDFTVAPAG